MLEVERLSVSYGKHAALAGVDVRVDRGEMVVILGANGAGKSTLLRAISGTVPAAADASIRLNGHDLRALEPHQIVEAGVALVPEGRAVFGELTVRENLMLGAFATRARPREREALARVLTLFPRLGERLDQVVRTMSGGEQQMVAIGRALMSSPDILLLDEPSLGLSPILTRELFQALGHIRSDDVGVLLVEQNARQSLDIADRGYLIESGRVAGSGSAASLKRDPNVQRAYLGVAGSGAAALRGVRPRIVKQYLSFEGPNMNQVKLLINGKEVPAAGGRTFDRINPVTGEVATRAAAASPADATKAAEAAAAAFPSWAALPPGERRARLMKAAEALHAHVEDFSRLVMEETGATQPWGGFNVMLAANMLREAAALTTQISGEVIPSDTPGSLAMAVRQPAGVVLGIAPWNAPIILGTRAVAAPLACGNTVILKASEMCPATHQLIGMCLNEAGLGDGVVNVITNDPKDSPVVVESMIAHPAVRRVNFTGSTRVGRIVAEMAARYLKPVVLELGGKAPLVILDDADLDEAVNAAAFGAFAHQGQICMSTERVVVDERVADVFAQKLAAKAASLPAGDPRGGNVVLGSLVDQTACTRIQGLVADAVKKGAKLLAGGEVNGTIMTATVLDRVTPEMRIYSEESFGPVVALVRVKDTEDAVRVANDTEYGLAAAVFGRDIARAIGVARRIESGICHVNAPTVHDEAQMPFGGTKSSGYGRFGGKAGIDEFTELRWITVQTEPRHYPF